MGDGEKMVKSSWGRQPGEDVAALVWARSWGCQGCNKGELLAPCAAPGSVSLCGAVAGTHTHICAAVGSWVLREGMGRHRVTHSVNLKETNPGPARVLVLSVHTHGHVAFPSSGLGDVAHLSPARCSLGALSQELILGCSCVCPKSRHSSSLSYGIRAQGHGGTEQSPGVRQLRCAGDPDNVWQ